MEEIILTNQNSNTYGEIRKQVLKKWLKETNRERRVKDFNDDFSASFFCKWQDKADKHINIFCSLGEWFTNISDILSEKKYDNLFYVDNEDTLFRVYTRFLLVISEIIEDLQDINAIIKGIDLKDKKKAGRDLEDGILDTKELKNISDYINKICKHKITYLHKHNNHLEIIFRDSLLNDELNFEHDKIISINNLDCVVDENYWIEIPRMNYFIDVIIKCYKKIDSLFKNENNFIMICEWHDKNNY